jgi:hypothetical protein
MKTKTQGEPLFSHHLAPKLEEVKTYFSTKGAPEAEAEDFYYVYENRHWRTGKGTFYKSWRVIAYRWIVSVLSAKRLCPDRRQPVHPIGFKGVFQQVY